MPKKEDRKADLFAGMGSMAARLKARREAIEAGEPEKAAQAYSSGSSVENTLRRREDAERFPEAPTEPKKRTY